MKISGFSFARNAESLYYPIAESICSALPLVDEFVVALGRGDEHDRTRERVEQIGSPKVRIIDTEWDLERYPNGTEHAHQTDIAKAECTGDWLLYLQADEVLHEKDLQNISDRCDELREREEVEGLLFRYLHFWGDYRHVHRSHGWYRDEIRVIRNRPDIHSWESAQSFRRIPDFDGRRYRGHPDAQKLRVARVDATIYHYGWVRPPQQMQTKRRAFDTNHHGRSEADRIHQNAAVHFDYGPMKNLATFQGRHPAVMADRLKSFNWGGELDYGSRVISRDRPRHKHEQFRYRLITGIEKVFNSGEELFGFRNYDLLDL